MRQFILIAGLVLASASAQAGDRSLSLSSSESITPKYLEMFMLGFSIPKAESIISPGMVPMVSTIASMSMSVGNRPEKRSAGVMPRELGIVVTRGNLAPNGSAP